MTLSRVWMLVGCVVLMLLASLVWASLQLGWHLAGHTDALPQPVPVVSSDAATGTPPDIAAITALAPFGAAVPDQVPDQASDRAPTLDIVLRGVLLDPDPKNSRAFVQVAGRVDVYRVGAPIQNGELISVDTETITVRSGDDMVIVGFDGIQDADGSAPVPAQMAAPATDTRNDPFARLAAAIVPANGSIDLREGPPPETTDDYINLWRDRIVRNPQAAMDSVGVELVENGYRVKPDPDIGVTLAGLRPGDVITRLNGQSIGDLDNDRKLYDEVAAAGIARLEVVRDGRSMLLTFPLR